MNAVRISKNRYVNFDGLRGIAILLVVLYHYFYTYHFEGNKYIHDTALLLFKYGSLGVQLFFIISGFVISFTLHKSKNLLYFAIARFSRLYPAYWCSMLLLTILTFFGAPNHDLHLYIKSLTMAPLLLGRGHLVGIYWTLEYELFFYIIAALLYKTNLFSKNYTYLLWLFLSLAWWYYSFDNLPDRLRLVGSYVFSYASLFIFGIYLYKSLATGWCKINAIILAGSLVVSVLTYQSSTPGYMISTARLWLTIIFFIALYATLVPESKIFSGKFLTFCGKISFSWYLTHFTFGFLMLDILEAHISPVVSAIITFCASMSLAYLFNMFIEKPLYGLFHKKSLSLQEYFKHRSSFSVQ